ncbi:hypothetical protein ACEPAI_4567 [Sanghuangporus weigelae]
MAFFTSSFVLIISFLFTFVFGNPSVKLKSTIINGVSVPDVDQEFFGGIPFAEPPVGSLRFSPPVLRLNPGVPVLNASQYGPACAQGVGFGINASQIESLHMSEDCLTLNVRRPAGLKFGKETLVPVMVWIYGGGFQNGAALQNDGASIVSRSSERGSPIIFVNLNYRLGPFGFPQGSEARLRGALNTGNKDVLAALAWVQENIEVFGGDKDRVTVFGVSAGAIILSELLLDPNFNLARAAIYESGSPATNMLFDASRREIVWQAFVSAVPRCSGAPEDDVFECLRNANTETIINATNYVNSYIQAEFPFAPVIDGPGGVIPDLPSKLYAQGRFARTPFITGTCLDEGTLFIPTAMNSSELLRIWIVSNLTAPGEIVTDDNPIADEILSLYPNDPTLGSPFGTGNETFGLNPAFKQAAAAFGDLAFNSLRRELVQAASDHGVKAFGYVFADRLQTNPPFLGVPHGCEIPYLFGSLPDEQASIFARTLIDYWISFATSLDPNDKLGNTSRPTWSQYTTSSKSVMQLERANLAMIPDTFREQQIAYLIDNAQVLNH